MKLDVQPINSSSNEICWKGNVMFQEKHWGHITYISPQEINRLCWYMRQEVRLWLDDLDNHVVVIYQLICLDVIFDDYFSSVSLLTFNVMFIYVIDNHPPNNAFINIQNFRIKLSSNPTSEKVEKFPKHLACFAVCFKFLDPDTIFLKFVGCK